MSFIVSMMIIDPLYSIHISNILYIVFISSIIFLTYLVLCFYRKKAFISQMNRYIEQEGLIDLPEGSTNEEFFYIQLLKKQHQKNLIEIEKLNTEKKEWLEYMTTWFHEVKTPLAVSKLIFETKGSMDSLEEEIVKIEHLIEQALYFSRLNEFNKDYLIQEIDVAKVVKEGLKLNMKSFLVKKININLHLQSLEVFSDKKGLLFMINQILSNALKYTPSQGEISISIKDRCLMIKDSGIGIAQEDLPRVFDKGFTGRNGRAYHNSTGMGLYLTKRMAAKLGHSIALSSNQNEYTEVVIHFPETEDDFFQLHN